jgi:hypothetical protein
MAVRVSVVLPDGDTYQVRRRHETRDASRFPVKSYPQEPDWTGIGASKVEKDRSYTLRLDTTAWPLVYDDLVTTPAGAEVLVRTAQLVPGDTDPLWDEVRHVAVTGEPRHKPQDDREGG